MKKDSEYEEKVISEKKIFSGHVVNLYVQEVLLKDGSTAQREIIKHLGAVGIIAVINDKIALVRQWRSPMGCETLEIPAGKINKEEVTLSPELIARRELREETGLVSDHFTQVAKFYGSPGYSNELFYLFEADNPQRKYQDLKLDTDEFLDIEWVTFEEVKKYIISGVICDAKTLLAINHWEMKKFKE